MRLSTAAILYCLVGFAHQVSAKRVLQKQQKLNKATRDDLNKVEAEEAKLWERILQEAGGSIVPTGTQTSICCCNN